MKLLSHIFLATWFALVALGGFSGADILSDQSVVLAQGEADLDAFGGPGRDISTTNSPTPNSPTPNQPTPNEPTPSAPAGGGTTQIESNPIILFDPVNKSITDIFLDILDIIMVFAIPIILFFIVWSGFLYVTAGGSEDQIKKASNALLYAIIGGVLILGARVLLAVITNTIESII